jgi:hypothetical protein
MNTSTESDAKKKGSVPRRQAGERPGNHDLSQVLIRIQVSPDEDGDQKSFKKIQRAFTNQQTGEKRSYEVKMPIIREFCKENAPRLFDAMHVSTLEAHKTSSGDGQNVYYQASKLLTEAFTDTAAEKEPEIREQIKVKLAIKIAEEKQEEDLKRSEESYLNSLLDLTIESPEAGTFVEDDLVVEDVTLEELTARFASGEFGFNFLDVEEPNESPSDDPDGSVTARAGETPRNAQDPNQTAGSGKKKDRSEESSQKRLKEVGPEGSTKKKKKETEGGGKKSSELVAGAGAPKKLKEKRRENESSAVQEPTSFKIPRRARPLVREAVRHKKSLSDLKRSPPALTGEELEARLNDPKREWGKRFCKEYFERLVRESVVNPNEAAEAQRNYMTHVMCKPFNMTIDQYVTRVKKMSSLLAYFPRNPDSEVQFNRPLTPIELNKVIFKGLPEKWRQQIETSNPNWAKKSEADFKEMLNNFEKHDLAARVASSKSNDKKTKSRKRKKDSEKRKAESWQTEAKRCKLCNLFGASASRVNSHSTDECKSVNYYRKKLPSATIPAKDSSNQRENSRKRKSSREVNAMEVDDSNDEKSSSERRNKNNELFESFMNMMMKEFKKRKTEYSSDSS